VFRGLETVILGLPWLADGKFGRLKQLMGTSKRRKRVCSLRLDGQRHGFPTEPERGSGQAIWMICFAETVYGPAVGDPGGTQTEKSEGRRRVPGISILNSGLRATKNPRSRAGRYLREKWVRSLLTREGEIELGRGGCEHGQRQGSIRALGSVASVIRALYKISDRMRSHTLSTPRRYWVLPNCCVTDEGAKNSAAELLENHFAEN